MEYLSTILTPVLTALIVWLIERDRIKKDDLRDEAEAVNRDVNSATMELAYATAMAVKRGQPNGEVEKAVEAYKAAKKKQEAFNLKLQDKMIK